MADIIYWKDEEGNMDWFVYAGPDCDEDLEMFRQDAKDCGCAVEYLCRDVDEMMIKDLGEFLFRTSHSDDDSLRDYLIDRFEGDWNVFVEFLFHGYSKEKIRAFRDRLTARLEK
jgi:hypothetical protein